MTSHLLAQAWSQGGRSFLSISSLSLSFIFFSGFLLLLCSFFLFSLSLPFLSGRDGWEVGGPHLGPTVVSRKPTPPPPLTPPEAIAHPTLWADTLYTSLANWVVGSAIGLNLQLPLAGIIVPSYLLYWALSPIAGATAPAPPHSTSMVSVTAPAGSQPGAMPLPQAIGAVPLFSHASSTVTPSCNGPTNGGACNPPTLAELEAMISPISPSPATATNHKAQPLILSSALPPVSARVVERIRAGAFVDLKELLPDNVALLQRLQETNLGTQASSSNSPRMRDIRDPLTWASCFMAFAAVHAERAEMRELLAYGQLVLQLARKHGGLGWVAYDSQFRQQAAAGASTRWSELNLSLMAATVFSAGGDNPSRACQLCFATDHTARDCALTSLEGYKAPARMPAPGRTTQRAKPHRNQEEICRRFNRGICTSPVCRFEHACSACQKPGHGSFECKMGANKSGGPEAPPSRSGADRS